MFQSYVVFLKVQGEIMWSFYGKQLQRDIQKEEGTERREKCVSPLIIHGEVVRMVPVKRRVGRGDRVVKHHLMR